MIHEVDESLRALLRRDALNGTDVDVVLDAPTKDWAARRNAPVVDLYLYDIREAMGERRAGWQLINNDDGITTGRRPFPRIFKLSYLVTAWTQRPEDEHRLLSAVLAALLKCDALPDEVLTGSLVDAAMPIRVTVAIPPPQDRAVSDIWSALGGELKPSLDVVVLAPFITGAVEVAGPPVLEPPTFRIGDGETSEEATAVLAKLDEADRIASEAARLMGATAGKAGGLGMRAGAGMTVRIRGQHAGAPGEEGDDAEGAGSGGGKGKGKGAGGRGGAAGSGGAGAAHGRGAAGEAGGRGSGGQGGDEGDEAADWRSGEHVEVVEVIGPGRGGRGRTFRIRQSDPQR